MAISPAAVAILAVTETLRPVSITEPEPAFAVIGPVTKIKLSVVLPLTVNPPVATTPASVILSVSLTVIAPPLAVNVVKLFVLLFNVIAFPTATKLAVPETARLPDPDWVIDPPEISVRPVPSVALVRVIAAVFTIAAVLLLMVSVPPVILLKFA